MIKCSWLCSNRTTFTKQRLDLRAADSHPPPTRHPHPRLRGCEKQSGKMKGNAMSGMRDQSHDGLVHGKQSMEWDRLDKETSMVGAERPRKGEEGGSQRRER